MFIYQKERGDALFLLVLATSDKTGFSLNFPSRHMGVLYPLLPGDPTSYPTENTFGGDPNEAPSQNQRFCDGVPVVHFGVPGQKFIIFDWGKFREPHSGFPPPLRRGTCLPDAAARSAAAHLSHGRSFYPTKHAFCGDPPVWDNPPIMRDCLFVLLKKLLFSH